jgi:hypothetical protein
VKPVSYFVRLLQALFICAVLLAPALGQIHKTVHALDDRPPSEQVLFSEHAKDSLECQALDHLGSGEALQSAAVIVARVRPIDGLQWPLIEKSLQAPVLFFSARAPPLFL